MDKRFIKTVICLALVLVAVISFFVIGEKASSIEVHAAEIASIDEKSETVLKLTAVSTLTSAAISWIPGDTATPIAEEIADFATYFILILCVLYSEKYLLTIIGLGVFRIAIPLACGLLIAGILSSQKPLGRLGAKLAVIAIAVYFAIPLGLHVSDMIYETYTASIESTISTAEELSGETAALDGQSDENVIQSILRQLSESVSSLTQKATTVMNNFIETLAVLIVTSCVIPVLVLLLMLWLVKILTGENLVPAMLPYPVEIRGNRGASDAIEK